MEYFLNLDLLTLSEWQKKDLRIGFIDAGLVSIVKSWQQRPALEHDEEDRVWINHSALLQEIPIFRIKSRALETRLKKLADCGILDRALKNTKNGNKAYYRLSDLYWEWHEWWRSYIGAEKDGNEIALINLEDRKPALPVDNFEPPAAKCG